MAALHLAQVSSAGLPEQLQVGVLLRQLILSDAQLPLQAAHLRSGMAARGQPAR
jgi:hypothetical protein